MCSLCILSPIRTNVAFCFLLCACSIYLRFLYSFDALVINSILTSIYSQHLQSCGILRLLYTTTTKCCSSDINLNVLLLPLEPQNLLLLLFLFCISFLNLYSFFHPQLDQVGVGVWMCLPVCGCVFVGVSFKYSELVLHNNEKSSSRRLLMPQRQFISSIIVGCILEMDSVWQ